MHRSCTGSSTALSGGPIVSLQTRVKVMRKPRRTACFSRRNKGPSGPGQRREAETKHKPSPNRKGRRTVETEAEPKAASMARALRGAQAERSGRRVGRAAEVRSEGLRERKFTKAGAEDGGLAELPDDPRCLHGGNGADQVGAESFVPYRDWRVGAAGSRKLKAASSRGSAGALTKRRATGRCFSQNP